MTRFSLSVAGAAVAFLSSAVMAGTVTSQSGSVSIGFEGDSEFLEFGTASFPVAFPGSATREYNGLIAGSENSSVGGLGRVTYDLDDADDGAAMDVRVSHSNEGGNTPKRGRRRSCWTSLRTARSATVTWPASKTGRSTSIPG